MTFGKKNEVSNQDESFTLVHSNTTKHNSIKAPLAIIGIGSRLPGDLRGIDELWNGLIEGKNCITDVPPDRWSLDKFYDSDVKKAGKIKNNKGGFIKGFKEFDADFFNIYPTVANSLDVRQRHLLEVTYEAFEDAGIKTEDLNGSNTAVMMGIFLGDETKKNTGEDILEITPHCAMGSADTSVPARLAYQFNLNGPTFAVDTACSSSLVAIHLACNALWNGEADMAIAGGVNIMTSHEHNIMLSKGGFLSPDGYCKSFDASGNGYVRGEGAGVIIIKPLEQAIKDGDNIYALIRNTVANSDGHTIDGLTVPNEYAQIEMLKKAYGDVGINPKDVDFIEAHGTGTALGDPKECFAFANVFSKGRSKDNPLIIGSIKSNIGHCEAVAGVAGLIKLVLSIKNQQIPPNLHFKKPNPKIKFDEWKLKVPTKLTAWPVNKKKPAIGGVNSFGAGGTNAHIVVEGFNENSPLVKAIQKQKITNDKACLAYSFFVLSAKNKEALKDLCQKYLQFLTSQEVDIASLCYSTFYKRSNLPEKLIVIINFDDLKKAKEKIITSLESYIQDASSEGLISGTSPDREIIHDQPDQDPLIYNSSDLSKKFKRPKLAFICSGQGPQWYAMGRQLLESCPVFSKVLNDIDKIFSKIAGYSILAEMKKDAKTSRISETRVAQPAIMAVQIGLIEMWRFVGVKPDGVVGHSIGEVAAAYAAGALSLEQAVEVIYYRSKEQDKASGKGKMLAAGLTYSEGANLLQKHKIKNEVSVAAINGPSSIVFSGDSEPLEKIARDLTERDIFNKFLQVNVPFHSYHMDIVKDGMLRDLRDLKPSKANIELFSTVTGKLAPGTHLSADYWYKNVRNSVFFNQAVERMVEYGYTHFIEIAPHPVLSSGVIDILSANKIDGEVISSLSRNIKDFEAGIEYELKNYLIAIAKAYIANINTDFSNIIRNAKPIKLPTYSWQHREFWMETKSHQDSRLKPPSHPFIKSSIEIASNPDTLIWELNIDPRVETYLSDHQISDTVVLPGAAQLEVAYEIGKQTYGEKFSHLENITFDRAIFLPENDSEPPKIRLEITSKKAGTYKLFTKQESEEQWQENGSGKMVYSDSKEKPQPKTPESLKDLQKRITNEVNVKDFYDMVNQNQELSFGPRFRLVKEIRKEGDEFLARIELGKDDIFLAKRYNIIPNLLDASFHVVLEHVGKKTYLPYHTSSFNYLKPAGRVLWTHIAISRYDSKKLAAKFNIYDDQGDLIISVDNIELNNIPNREELKELYDGLYQFEWIRSELNIGKSLIEPSNASNQNKENVLIIIDRSGYGEKIAEILPKDLYNIIKVKDSDGFRSSKKGYEANLLSREDFVKLFKALESKKLHRIINCWPIDFKVTQNCNSSQFKNISRDLIMPCLNLLQELAEMDYGVKVYFATSLAAEIDIPDGKINFIQGSLYGIIRVFNNECSMHRSKIIDLESPDLNGIKSLANEIINDAKGHLFETESAYRNNHRYIRRLVNLDTNQDRPSEDESFLKDVTYLITGGASGLGLTIAEWMFNKGAKNFGLISRSGPKTQEDIEIINKLQKAGANINWEDCCIDINEEQKVVQAMEVISKKMPPIKGIIHCAGILDDGAITNMTEEKFMSSFIPKAVGAWNLHRSSLKYNPDIFFLISSVSSIIGVPGQINYSAANSFLNSFAFFRNIRSCRSSAFCFGLLGEDYSGMTKGDPKALDQIYDKIGTYKIDLNSFIKKFELGINLSRHLLVLSPINWDNYVKSFPDSPSNSLYSSILGEKSKNLKSNHNVNLSNLILSKPSTERSVFLSQALTESLSEIVGISSDKISSNKSINNIGLDSLMLNQFRNWIQSNLDINYPLIKLAKGPTIISLSDDLITLLEDKGQNINMVDNVYGVNDNMEDLEIFCNKWLVKVKGNSLSKIKIFCLHPVGAGASMFSHFMFNPPQNSEIVAIQMPGRENRVNEEMYRDMSELIPDLANILKDQIDCDTIFWGHSWGGVALFEVANYMRDYYPSIYKKIKHLVVTASIAPQLTLGWKKRDSIKETSNLDNNFAKVIKTVSYIEDKSFLEKIFPIMQHDMKMISTYDYKENPKLQIPITAFGALEDEVVLIEEIKQWNEQTSNDFKLFEVHGDHWFLSRNEDLILDKIQKIVDDILSSKKDKLLMQ